MNDKERLDKLVLLRADMHAMVFNYFYDGWKYRVEHKIDTYEEVAKDCNDAATRMITEFEMLIKEHYENLNNK